MKKLLTILLALGLFGLFSCGGATEEGSVLDNAVDAVKETTDAAADKVGDAADATKEVVGDAADKVGEVAGDAVDKVEEGVDSLASKAKAVGEDVKEAVTGDDQ